MTSKKPNEHEESPEKGDGTGNKKNFKSPDISKILQAGESILNRKTKKLSIEVERFIKYIVGLTPGHNHIKKLANTSDSEYIAIIIRAGIGKITTDKEVSSFYDTIKSLFKDMSSQEIHNRAHMTYSLLASIENRSYKEYGFRNVTGITIEQNTMSIAVPIHHEKGSIGTLQRIASSLAMYRMKGDGPKGIEVRKDKLVCSSHKEMPQIEIYITPYPYLDQEPSLSSLKGEKELHPIIQDIAHKHQIQPRNCRHISDTLKKYGSSQIIQDVLDRLNKYLSAIPYRIIRNETLIIINEDMKGYNLNEISIKLDDLFQSYEQDFHIDNLSPFNKSRIPAPRGTVIPFFYSEKLHSSGYSCCLFKFCS